ncbi:MAG: hypothetical protein RL685_1440 [Pseudomonadota bacterium]
MSETSKLLAELRRSAITVWAEGDQLRVRAPKGALTPELTARLTRHKADLLLTLQAEQQAQGGPQGQGLERDGVAEPIPRAAPGTDAPLSFAQQRLWFLQQLQPGTSTYNMPLALLLAGPLDVAALRSALEHVWRRHEVLRTRFTSVDGRPALALASDRECRVLARSLEELPDPERELQRLAAAAAAHPFDLEQELPLRVELLRLGPARHALLVTAHHIAFDGWSTGVFASELSLAYAAHRAGREPALAALPVQYADYARWQRRWLEGAALESQLGYWREQLAGAPPALDFPTDRPRPALASARGSACYFELEPSLCAGLERLAGELHVTPFMLLLSAFCTLLQRYSGQTDFVVGTPVAGRARTELEPLIGCFVNTLPLRVRPEGRQTLRDFIAVLRRTCLDAYANQDVPFELLVERLQPQRDLGRNPLFQYMFSLENAPGAALELAGIESSWLSTEWTAARLDLTLSLSADGDVLRGGVEYAADLFDSASIERFIEHYRQLLGALLQHLDTPLARLPLTASGQRASLPLSLSPSLPFPALDQAAPRARRPAHVGATFLDAFAARVDARPDAVALEFEGRRLSYRELLERAHQLAGYLRERGIGAGDRVAFCIERSPEMVVGLLAVLLTGAAYVPLDPSYPARRLAFMLQDCQPSLLLTEERWLSQLDTGALPVVLVDAERESIAACSSAPPPRVLGAATPAYVIYTSGSTGLPKGVEVSHGALANLLGSMRVMPGLGADDRLLALTTICFDIAGLELFLPLVVGARCVLVSSEVARDPARLSRAIVDSAATVLQATPATFQLLVAAEFQPGALRRVLCGGEALSRPLADALLGRGLELWNVYGPTETTIWSTVERVGPPRHPGERIVSIGRAIDDTRLHVIDPRGEPAPAGAIGELCIAGAGVAHGYFRRPALTAERFIPEPGAPEPGARMYRTGDRVRLRSDGSLEFLGRIDHQVKLRGHRIELGEIEAMLSKHSGLRAAAVVLRELEPGDARLLAYVVPSKQAVSAEELRSWLRERLPEVMVPSWFLPLAALPLTPNGKVDRSALPLPARALSAPAGLGAAAPDDGSARPPQGELEQRLVHTWREVLQRDSVGVDQNFFDLGGHSLLLVQLHARLQRELDRRLRLVDLFRCPTVRSLAEHLARVDVAPAPLSTSAAALTADEPIAIVGMAGRFPRARNLTEFWQHLRNGRECIQTFTEAELIAAGVPSVQVRDPRYVPARGVLDDVDCFDAAFFGVAPSEAQLMDPQQRILLEVGWEALEHAGYGGPLSFPVGVFASASQNVYPVSKLAEPPPGAGANASYLAMIGNEKDYLATRLSYLFALEGPSLSVQTACSSSLVAVHLACASLRSGECDMALAGGVCVQEPVGYLYEDGMVSSPDGHCRAFDERAAGTVWGSGAGMVVLRRLSDALRDGDCVHALIRGSAVNNDGARKVGYMAPSIPGQAAVIRRARLAAGVEACSIGYIEAHGTGTPLGDPIELAALREATPHTEGEAAWCALGSVKTNIGHLDAAAGIAGLLKAVLALRHRELPPTVHFERPNPRLELGSSPFFIPAALRPWPTGATPRRAGVSSFGIGGTNAHVVLEEASTPAPSPGSSGCQLLLLSARSEAALTQLSRQLGEHLLQHPELALDEVAFTLQAGRRRHAHRKSVVAASTEEAARALAAPAELASPPVLAERPVAFLFPGQGAQYVGMGQELYQTEPVLRQAVDRCAQLLQPALGLDLRALLYPELYPELQPSSDAGARPEPTAVVERARRLLDQTRFTQPALFTISYATAQLWLSWGVQPDALLGHSIGEYVAATLAGVFTLEDALGLVAARGSLVQSLPEGGMLAVPLPATELEPLLGAELSLAARNSPAQCVASGPSAAIERLSNLLANRGIVGKRLPTSHAFHSALLDPVLTAFAERVRALRLGPPRIPFVSNVSGTWITAEQATSADYWVRQLRQTVDFAGALDTLCGLHEVVLVEVGPGRTLGGFARALPAERQPALVVASLPGASDPSRAPGVASAEARCIKTSFGRLWQAGAKLERVAARVARSGRRVPLPTYPFERTRHWLDVELAQLRAGPPPREPSRAGPSPAAPHFYLPSFKPALALPGLQPGELTERRCFWLLGDSSGPTLRLAGVLESEGQEVVTVFAGDAFARVSERSFVLRPGVLEDYERLAALLAASPPAHVIQLWNGSSRSEPPRSSRTPPARTLSAALSSAWAGFEACQERGFHSLLALSRALSAGSRATACRISIVSDQLFPVPGGSAPRAESSPIAGLAPVIAQEYPQLSVQLIDFVPEQPGSLEAHELGLLLAEMLSPVPAPRVALRDGDRWLPALELQQLDEQRPIVRAWRARGTYLITGGLGYVGLELALQLARSVQARLILTTRGAFPPRSDWSRWRTEQPGQDLTCQRIVKLQEIEAAGAEVLILQADVADLAAMQAALAQGEARFGPLQGVVHAAGSRNLGSFVTPLSEADRAGCDAHFRPKVGGCYVLDALLGERTLDFCVLVSSTSALLGGLGLGPYAAANRFLDAFVQTRPRAQRHAWLALAYDAWSFAEPGATAEPSAAAEQLALSAQLGREAFEHAVCRGGARHLIVAASALEPRLNRWVEGERSEPAVGAALQPMARHPRPQIAVAFVAPRTELEVRLAGILAAVLGFEAVGVHDDLFELGGDSLSAIQITARIHAELGQHLSPALLLQTPTVAELAGRLQQVEPAASSPAVAIQPRGHASPLFWVPGTGGNVIYFQPLASQLEVTGHPFYALEPIGVDGREPPRSSVPEIASSYIAALRAVQPHGPYFIGGHSFGSWVAYELTQQLLDRGESIERLAVLDTVAPAERDLSAFQGFTGADWILTLAHLVGELRSSPLPLSRERLLECSWEQQLDLLCEALQAAGYLAPGATRQQIRGLVEVYRTQAQMEYRRPPGRPVPIVLLRATERHPDGDVVPAAVRRDPSWGWQAYAAGDVAIEDVPGDHLTMMTHPHVRALAERVRLHLPAR